MNGADDVTTVTVETGRADTEVEIAVLAESAMRGICAATITSATTVGWARHRLWI